jgi:hypothetical protein
MPDCLISPPKPARAAEFKAARRVAPDFADKLKQAGVARLLVPQPSGGLGCSGHARTDKAP